MNALIRLRRYNEAFAKRCFSARWFAAAFHVGVEKHLIDDVADAHRAIVDATYKAETLDREAVKLLDAVLADGTVTIEEIGALRKARTMVQKSAEVDHDAGELAHVAA